MSTTFSQFIEYFWASVSYSNCEERKQSIIRFQGNNGFPNCKACLGDWERWRLTVSCQGAAASLAGNGSQSDSHLTQGHAHLPGATCVQWLGSGGSRGKKSQLPQLNSGQLPALELPMGSDEDSSSSTAPSCILHPSQMLIPRPLHPKSSCTQISVCLFPGKPKHQRWFSRKRIY